MIVGEIDEPIEETAKRLIAGGVVLDVLADVPPRQQLGERRHLGCLTYVARFLSGLRGGCAGGPPHGLLRASAPLRRGHRHAWSLEPSLLPIDEAARLAAAIGRAIAPQLEMHGIVEAAAA